MGKILRVTMEDVAKAAGVSQAAVSMALRKHAVIPAATRDKIVQVAAKLGYQQDGVISTMMARVRMQKPIRYQATLGAIIAWPNRNSWRENETFRRYLSGAKKRASELGFRFDEFWLSVDAMTPERLRQILLARHVEGLVLMPLPKQGSLKFDLTDFASAAIGYTIQDPPVHRAITAHYEEMLETLRQLELLGYSKVAAALDCEVNDRIERKWSAAFSAYVPRRESVLQLKPDNPDNLKIFDKWLKQVRPDALVACNIPAGKWLHYLGKRIPDDIGVAVLGERFQDKSYSRIDERSDHVGAAAVELVVAQLHRNEKGLPACPRATHVEGIWVNGPSLRNRETISTPTNTD